MDDNNDIIEWLRTFAHRNDPDRVIDAEKALQPLGDVALHVLVEALGDPDADLRILALQLLEHFDGDTEPALPAMIKALKDPDRIVRIAAIGLVARLAEKASDSVPILEKWIGSDDVFRAESVAASQAAARRNGKTWSGSEKGWRWRVTDDQVTAIHEMKTAGKPIAQIARVIGLSRPTIYRVLREVDLV